MRRLASTIGGVLLLASCSSGGAPAQEPTPTRTPVTGACSAAGLSETAPEPPGLPAGVATMRKDILEAAVRCEYDLLGALAERGSATFNYSFGAAGEPGAYWERQERDGDDVLAVLVRLLGMEPGRIRTGEHPIWTWPAAAGEGADDADYQDLRETFPDRDTDAWRSGEGFLGPRVGIDERGDWLYYVAGD